jgi:small subunit ribosomal protein S19
MLGHRFGEFSLTRNKVKHSSAGVGATKGSKSKSKK